MHTTVCHQAMRVWVNSTSWCSSIPHQSVMSSSHSLWGFPPTPSICPNIIILTNLILQICPKRFNFLSITICTRLLSDSTQFLITVFVIFHCQPIWSAQLPVDNISSQKPRSAACPSSSESMIHMHTVAVRGQLTAGPTWRLSVTGMWHWSHHSSPVRSCHMRRLDCSCADRMLADLPNFTSLTCQWLWACHLWQLRVKSDRQSRDNSSWVGFTSHLSHNRSF